MKTMKTFQLTLSIDHDAIYNGDGIWRELDLLVQKFKRQDEKRQELRDKRLQRMDIMLDIGKTISLRDDEGRKIGSYRLSNAGDADRENDDTLDVFIVTAQRMRAAIITLCESLAWEEKRSGTTYSGYEDALQSVTDNSFVNQYAVSDK